LTKNFTFFEDFVSDKKPQKGGSRFRGGGKIGSLNEPLITVITSTLNAERYLPTAIRSIREQNYKNIEYIVVDCASTDGTVDILRANEDIIDCWLSESDDGIYDAWNKAIKLSHGEWLAFLGADDAFMGDAIQNYVDFINKYDDSSLEYVSSKVNLIDNSLVLQTIGKQWNWSTFKRYMNIAHPGSFHRRKLFREYGFFNTDLKICSDYEFLLRPKSRLHAAYLNVVTVNMRAGGLSNTDLRAVYEAAIAKTISGKRNFFFCEMEKYWAITKWHIKRILR
jgi:glycosyltransferase involved in cell wall biosynthesis